MRSDKHNKSERYFYQFDRILSKSFISLNMELLTVCMSARIEIKCMRYVSACFLPFFLNLTHFFWKTNIRSLILIYSQRKSLNIWRH